MLIFVYGTLRQGGGLSFKLADAGRFIGTFYTLPKYTLYDAGIPCLSKGGKTCVIGDLYEIEDLSDIVHIHSMEIRAGYTLDSVELVGESNACAYFQKPDTAAIKIISGDWVSYRENKHGKRSPKSRAVNSNI